MNKKQIAKLEERISSSRSTMELPFFITVKEGKAYIGETALHSIGVKPELYELSSEHKSERIIPLEDSSVFRAHDKDRLYWANSDQTSLKIELS